MAESSVNVTEGSGKRLHTFDRTISSVLVQDQFTAPGEYPYASYVAISAVSIATANDHVLQLMAGSSSYVRIRRIRIEQSSNATTAAIAGFEVRRLNTAGTGGSTVNCEKFDVSDAAADATAMSLPSSKGTEGSLLVSTRLIMRQAVSTTVTQPEEIFEWVQLPNQKPFIIGAGTSNGICIKSTTAIAGATLVSTIEFVETPFGT